MSLQTQYLGMTLANPIVPSASPLSRDLATCCQLEDAGASALVMYSLFEEELHSHQAKQLQLMESREIGHSEASHFLPIQTQPSFALEQYLNQIQALKQRLAIPIIASLNGTTSDGWISIGQQLVEAGADALELNIYLVAADPRQSASEIEAGYLSLIKELRQKVQCPIVVKLSPFFSALGHFVKQLEATGVQGVSLFNRFYQPDIDPDSLRVQSCIHLSRSEDALLTMRWLGILFGKTQLTLAATGGIHTTDDAVKMLLAGADVTHLCSALLLQGPSLVSQLLVGIGQWLEESPYESIEQAKGVLSHLHTNDPMLYERASYVDLLKTGHYSTRR